MADTTSQNVSGRGAPSYSGSASGQSAARPKGGTGGRRYVRTAQGAARYHKPIGTEIVATPRDQRGAVAQTDKESTDRYKGLVSANPDDQRKAMAGLSDDQLKRLSEVAFSFSSSDPQVARLRAGVALEMRSRGLDINRYGGLAGRGSASSSVSGGSVEAINFQTGEHYRVPLKASADQRKAASASAADERRALHEATMQETKRRQIAAKAERDRLAAEKRLKAQQLAAAKQQTAAANREATRQAQLERAKAVNQRRQAGRPSRVVRLSELDLAYVSTQQRQQAQDKGQALPGGRFPIRNVTDLRAALNAFGRVKPEDRQKVARFICKRAKALNAGHMLGDGIRKAAGYSTETDMSVSEPIVVDLAGSWKHGWIPLDATAVHAKTRGRQGAKPWWSEGAKGRTGTSSGKGGKSAAQRYQQNAPDRIAHSSLPGGEYRKNADGTYDLHVNGRKSRNSLDQNLTRRQLAVARRSETKGEGRSVPSRATKGQYQTQHRPREFYERSAAKSVRRNQGKPNLPRERTNVVKSGMTTDKPSIRSVEIQHKGGPAVRGTEQSHGAPSTISGRESLAARNPNRPKAVSVETLQHKGGPAIPGSKRDIAPTPKSPLATATLGKRMAGSPEGLDAYPLKDKAGGQALYDIAVYREGKLVGFVKKRSGYSQHGKPGAAERTKNTGYSFFDAKGHRIGNASSRASALSSLRLR